MNSLDTGKDKIKKICEILEKETLEPAKVAAGRLIQDAEEKALKIIEEAQLKAKSIVSEAKETAEKNQRFFENSLKQGFSSAKEQLRQDIEKTLFSETFAPWVQKNFSQADVAAELVKALVEAIKKEGTEGDVSAYVAKHIPSSQVNALVGQALLARLKEKEIQVGAFNAGVQVKLHKQQLTLDLSDEAIIELLTGYISKEFRDIIFQG
jgi:V/A-type H+-transporting ATPase subunit E